MVSLFANPITSFTCRFLHPGFCYERRTGHHEIHSSRRARFALDAASSALTAKVPHEMLLLDLYNALRPLDAITGATTTDDILNLIFSTFCIGK